MAHNVPTIAPNSLTMKSMSTALTPPLEVFLRSSFSTGDLKRGDSPRVAFRFEKLIYISYKPQNVNTFCQIGMLHLWKNLQFSLAKIAETAYTKIMKIYLGSDHRGFLLKEKVFAYLAKNGYDVEDVGGVELNPDDDFPQFAQAAALKVIGDDSKDPRAILICGGGQGMCMAANRFKGIRASVIWDAFEAKMTRNDNDSNVLCLPARILEDDEVVWKGIIET